MANVMDDLYQAALKETNNPKIFYSLSEMKLKPGHVPGKPFEFDTKGNLAIAGVTHKVSMVVTIENTNKDKLLIVGSCPIKMIDWRITPPAPSFGLGLMKVAPDVTVSFKWVLKPAPAAWLIEYATNTSPLDLGMQNLAFGIIPTSSDTNVAPGQLAKITDGKKSRYPDDIVLLRKGTKWVQIDLGRECQIYSVSLWHAYDTPKTYHDVIIQAATDPDFSQNVQTIFNNDRANRSGLGVGEDSEYAETVEGKKIDVNGLVARYLRFYSHGSTDSAMNEYTEIEIYGD
jgi:hypothetical protein